MLPFLVRELPSGLQTLAETAANLVIDLRWTWSHIGDSLWRAIDTQTWERTKNPYVVIQNLTQERLEELDRDTRFKTRLQTLVSAHQDYCNQPGWYGETHADSNLKGIAYFSMEFGLGEALPLYAGGLGVLAGDYLKAVSDMAVPLVGVGLLYQEGYFRQILDDAGWQQEVYHYNDATNMPVRPVQGRDGAWLHVHSDFPGRRVRFRVWQAQVGRVTLYLLDSNDPLNSPSDRSITSKLYGGGQEMRLVQEIALGICGWRLIEALGLDIDICHLNEGHAAFVTLERARCYMERNKVDFWEALWATRAGNLFTTHTPVAAGFDSFVPGLLLKYGTDYAQRLGVDLQELGALARKDPENDDEPFNMTYLAMRTCSIINGVSRLHGEVSRHLFRDLYPRWPDQQIPVTHITNGVHLPTWNSPWADKAWKQAGGKEYWRGSLQGFSGTILENMSDEVLWKFRGQERLDLIHHARIRLARQLGQRGADPDTVKQAQCVLDPDTLTLGIARRFAEYKRPNLLLNDQDRLVRLLTNKDRPVQIIVAGKAHPQDEQGKYLIQAWAQFVARPEIRNHAVFLEDYDIDLAKELVQGVDVWINTPRRPWEASGTSGMKVLVNGGLNLSELDGWWAEAYSPEVGWALGDGQEHAGSEWDTVEAEQLYRFLEEEIVPLFYTRNTAGIPQGWVSRIRASMSRLVPRFSTNRMVREYVEQLYLPAANALQSRTRDQGRLARQLRNWELDLKSHWSEIHFGNTSVKQTPDNTVFEVQVYLGDIDPDHVEVQLYSGAAEYADSVCQSMTRGESITGDLNGYTYYVIVPCSHPLKDITARVIPHHKDARVPAELSLILWQH
ncbi:MAG: alpha-glucan family phosphorylase [Gammaproteobacteria bacterium]|nr:MAG: alpha-glucan family phosphorylase [Gammaproteobacteria bacterium]